MYHVNCFKCHKCFMHISTGQKYGILDDKLHCELHYMSEMSSRNSYLDRNFNSPCSVSTESPYSSLGSSISPLSYNSNFMGNQMQMAANASDAYNFNSFSSLMRSNNNNHDQARRIGKLFISH